VPLANGRRGSILRSNVLLDAVELTYKTAEGGLGQRVLGHDAEEKLAIAHVERAHSMLSPQTSSS
jgi:hypothetical protein